MRLLRAQEQKCWRSSIGSKCPFYYKTILVLAFLLSFLTIAERYNFSNAASSLRNIFFQEATPTSISVKEKSSDVSLIQETTESTVKSALPLLDYNLEVTQWLWRNLGGPISDEFLPHGIKSRTPSTNFTSTTSISTQDIVRELAKWLPKEKSSQCLDSSQNKSCIVVGNSANLLGKNLGVVIDSHDVVFRLNTAKTRNFESDVGSKTCMRIIYPESASLVANNQSRESEILFQAYKDEDLLWLLLASDQRVNSVIRDSLFHGLKFWAKVPNPSTYSSKVRRTFVLNPLMMRNVRLVAGLKGNPTSGLVAIVLALKSCNSVTIAGFGYSRDRSVSAHYYEVKESSTILNRKNPGRHSVRDEANFIARLAARKFIKNLTPFP